MEQQGTNSFSADASTLEQLVTLHHEWTQTILAQQKLQFHLGRLISGLCMQTQQAHNGDARSQASFSPPQPATSADQAPNTGSQDSKPMKRGRVMNASRIRLRVGPSSDALSPAHKAPRSDVATSAAPSPRSTLQLMRARYAAHELATTAAVRGLASSGLSSAPPLPHAETAASIASGQATASRASSGESSPDTISKYAALESSSGASALRAVSPPPASAPAPAAQAPPPDMAPKSSAPAAAAAAAPVPTLHSLSALAVHLPVSQVLAASHCTPAPRAIDPANSSRTGDASAPPPPHTTPPVQPLSDSGASAEDSGSEFGGDVHEDGIPDSQFIAHLKRAELLDMATVSHVPMPSNKPRYKLVRRMTSQSAVPWRISLPDGPDKCTWEPLLAEAAAYHGDYMAAMLREWCLIQVMEINPLAVDTTSLAEHLSVWPIDKLQAARRACAKLPQKSVTFNFPSMHQYWVSVSQEDPFGRPTWTGPNMLTLARMGQRARIHVRSPGIFRLLLALAYVVDCARGTRDAGDDMHRIMALRPAPHTFDDVQAFDVTDHAYTCVPQRPGTFARVNVELAMHRRQRRAAAGTALPPITSVQMAHFMEQGKSAKVRSVEHPTMFGIHAIIASATHPAFGHFAVKQYTQRNPGAKGLGKSLRFKTDFMAALVREYGTCPKRSKSNCIKQNWVKNMGGQKSWEGPAVQFLARYERAHPDNKVTMDNFSAISDMAHQGQLLPPRLPGAVQSVLPEWANIVVPLPPSATPPSPPPPAQQGGASSAMVPPMPAAASSSGSSSSAMPVARGGGGGGRERPPSPGNAVAPPPAAPLTAGSPMDSWMAPSLTGLLGTVFKSFSASQIANAAPHHQTATSSDG